jgi:hypothetical protein
MLRPEAAGIEFIGTPVDGPGLQARNHSVDHKDRMARSSSGSSRSAQAVVGGICRKPPPAESLRDTGSTSDRK